MHSQLEVPVRVAVLSRLPHIRPHEMLTFRRLVELNLDNIFVVFILPHGVAFTMMRVNTGRDVNSGWRIHSDRIQVVLMTSGSVYQYLMFFLKQVDRCEDA